MQNLGDDLPKKFHLIADQFQSIAAKFLKKNKNLLKMVTVHCAFP